MLSYARLLMQFPWEDEFVTKRSPNILQKNSSTISFVKMAYTSRCCSKKWVYHQKDLYIYHFLKNCVNDDCPVCNSKNVVLKWPHGLIEMENCESDIADVKRKSHASSICLALLQDGLCAPIESLIDTCPVVPKKFMRKY